MTISEDRIERAAFQFDRYINGILMAEGVIVKNAENLEQAVMRAFRLCARHPGDVATLVLRDSAFAAAEYARGLREGLAEARAEGVRDGLIWAADKARTLKTLRAWLPTGNDGKGETEHVTKHGIEIAEAIEARLYEMGRQPVDEQRG